MSDSAIAAEEARKNIKHEKPIHKNKFSGSPRKLKGRTLGKWVRVGHKLIYIPPKKGKRNAGRHKDRG